MTIANRFLLFLTWLITLIAALGLLLLLSGCAPTPQPTPSSPPPTVPATQPAVSLAAPTPSITASATLSEPTLPPAQASSTLQPTVQLFKIAANESQVSYQVGETFINQNNLFAQAVGITHQVQGDIWLDLEDPRRSVLGPVTVDISQFQSDSALRDQALRERFLESDRYPLAVFTPHEIVGFHGKSSPGVEYALFVRGDLTVRTVTRPVQFTVFVKYENNALSGRADALIKMSDFGIGPIEIAGILKTQDDVKLLFTFVARPEN